VDRIAFARNEHGAPTFEVADDSYGAIGSLLNSWDVRITRNGLQLGDLYSDWSASYPLDVAHDVMIRYWMFLTGGAADEAGTSVAGWEAKAGREHPCRPHL
jgi:hypothetical protein